MIHQPDPTENSQQPRDISERYVSMLLEMDAAIAGGEATDVDSTSLAGLTPDEQRKLQEARTCLELLYLDAADGEPSCGNELPAVPESTDVVAPNLGDNAIQGARFGRFEVVREIGRGGHGVVFLARDPMLNRNVALKMPHPEILLTPAMRRRFLSEGKAAALLTHPNIVTVYEAGELGPVCYLAQEFVTGQTLSQWLQSPIASRTPRMAAAVIAQLCDGVDHAHKRGILHRDLKPGNVILQDAAQPAQEPNPECAGEGLPCTPKIMDFGIAKTVESDEDETATGTVIGTANYMSPEQAAGQNRELGPASDVYSLGAILYELLTGRPVFLGDNRIETLRLVATVEPTRPRKLRREIPLDLEAICLKCLEKEPRRRYASAFELANDLRRFLAGEPTRARPTTATEKALRWCRRRPALASLIGVSCTAIISLLAVVLWSKSELEETLAKTTDQRRRAERNEALANQREIAAQERAYAADMRLVAEYWNDSNVATINSFMLPYIPARGRPDLRGFEWWLYYRRLKARVPPSGNSQFEGSAVTDSISLETERHPAIQNRSFDSDISSLAVHPDGSQIAVSNADGILSLLDFETLSTVRTLRDAGTNAFIVAYSPTGETLALAAKGEPLELYFQSGAKHAVDLPTTIQIGQMRFTPDGRKVLIADQSDLVVVDLGTQAVVGRLSHRGAVRDFGFIDDDKLLVSSAGGDLYRWSLRDVRKPLRISRDLGELYEVVVSIDAQCVAVRGERRVIIFELPTLDILANLPDRGEPGGMAFLGKGRTLMTAESNSGFRLWQTRTLQQMGHLDAIAPVGAATSVDGYRLVAYGRNSLTTIDARPFNE